MLNSQNQSERIMMYCKSLISLSVVLILYSFVWADVEKITMAFEERAGFISNDLGNLVWDGNSLWVSGSGAVTNLTGEGNNIYDWISYYNMAGFGQGIITAFYASGDTLVTAWMYDEIIAGESYDIGDGLSLSFDHGQTWHHIPVTAYFPERAEWSYPGGRTLTWDIVFTGKTMWCSTTSGFLLKTDDLGITWTRFLPGEKELDHGNLNHHAFCVDAYGDSVWVGTMQGINASFDGGETWSNFSWPLDGSGEPSDQRPGNFVVSVEHNTVGGKTHVWVGSQKELANTGLGVDGICHTDDNGETWEYKTTEYSAWNFAFGYDGASDPKVSNNTVLAASDSGLLISYDLGETWSIMNIRESEDIYWETGNMVYDVLVVADTLWVSSSNGLARSNDWGKSWKIYRQEPSIVQEQYIFPPEVTIHRNYPNPFNSSTTIEYNILESTHVTLTIYNFTGQVVKIMRDEYQKAGNYSVTWNASRMPSGLYFSIVKANGLYDTKKMLLIK